ncbi:exopolysaccharide biosynthesis polyprenyl glycosylphosphotransferase [Aquimarina agarilytica]|uniref:exopolysaccharide biosynthesis polyprenyl glycosylphosphotransferase n=1 Tax=Aquimarina agarilytica TaxID=1087449 RepID=UPI000287E4A5|nr:exopolysaccharide biosynthesis polyprenyl glycosylphosphotransferase [Aquimarina agarilytica]
MPKALKGYSFLIRPLIVLFDLVALCFCAYFLLGKSGSLFFYAYLIFGWLVSSIWVRFYKVYRFTSVLKIIRLIVKQAFLLMLVLYSYYGIIKSRTISGIETVLFLAITILIISLSKFAVYFLLQKYRQYFGGNKRWILVFGSSAQTQELITYFESKPEMGYYIQGVFADSLDKKIVEGIKFLKENRIDEVYCALHEVSNTETNEIVNFCESNGIVLKFIPDVEKVPVSNLKTDYYEYLPVLSIPNMPLHDSANVIVKRFIDIVISLVVIIGILSWLIPLMYVVIKLESKGPLFYRHKRNGVNYGEFMCYKFRSLSIEGNEQRLHVSEADERVTKVGRFLRRTSIDEIPQFINVLRGEMSVVGPRPHIPRYTEAYAKKIDKYQFVFRHSVRPGITGLAQIKGYRGEIKSDDDIINRIKYDVFYIENWSILMDIKIMFDTLLILLKGHDKAY